MALDQDQDMANNNSSTLPSRPAANSTSQSKLEKPTGDKQDTKMTSDDASESNSDDESSSEAESSSDNDSTSDEEDNDIPTLKPGVKPDFSSARKLTAGAPSLQDRLKAFLPQLAEANSKLTRDGPNAFSMEDVKEDEPHIEMDLGLGVLEEKRDGEESEDEEDDEDDMDGEEKKERKRKEKDVMSELMGRKGENKSTKGIQEVE